MKIILEGDPKEIAALVLELQERRRELDGVSEGYAYDLVVENDEISNADIRTPIGTNRYIR